MQSNDDDKSVPNVLLVEDDRIVQKVHQLQLEQLNCVVDIAANGTQALALHLKGYNIILLDCGLPDMDGFEVCKRIRQQEQLYGLPPVPIIMVSAFLRAELEQQCKDVGINELVIKPIVSDEQMRGILLRWS